MIPAVASCSYRYPSWLRVALPPSWPVMSSCYTQRDHCAPSATLYRITACYSTCMSSPWRWYMNVNVCVVTTTTMESASSHSTQTIHQHSYRCGCMLSVYTSDTTGTCPVLYLVTSLMSLYLPTTHRNSYRDLPLLPCLYPRLPYSLQHAAPR